MSKLKGLLRLTATAMFAATVPVTMAADVSQAPQSGTPLTVYTAKKIITMEPDMPEATAVAVADGRIVSVGSLDSLQDWIEQRGATIDRSLEDKVLMPGFIDPHVHPSLPAVLTQFPWITPIDWSLPNAEYPGATSNAEYVKLLKAQVEAHYANPKHDPKVPFISYGYHPMFHGQVYREDLDKLFGDKPVALWHMSFHEMFFNTAALQLMSIDEKSFGQDNANWATGHAWEGGLMKQVSKLAFVFDPTQYSKGMENFLAMLLQSGTTTALDMGVGIFGDPVGEANLIRQIAEGSEAPARIILTPTTVDFPRRGVSIEDALKEVDAWHKTNSKRVLFSRDFKLQVDGGFYNGLAQFGEPGYMDGHQGLWMMPLPELSKWAEAFWKAGYQLHAHANGDESVGAMINLVEALQSESPRVDHRFVLEHFAYATEDQIRKIKALGMVVSANPIYNHVMSDLSSEQWFGQDRGRQLSRLGSLERQGIPFGLHSDAPMAPLNPLFLAWAAVNRVTLDGTVTTPEQKVSVDAALRAITIDAAWVMKWEDEIGSIRAGKKADFTVLEQDPYQVDPMALKDIPVWGVVFEGEVHPAKQSSGK